MLSYLTPASPPHKHTPSHSVLPSLPELGTYAHTHFPPSLPPSLSPLFFFCSSHQVLDVRLPFSERQLILDNLPYLKRALKLDSLTVSLVTDTEALAKAAQPVDPAAAYPGNPVFSFTVESS